MGRPRRQEPRRAHLLAAARRVLERDGLVGLRVREVAAEAGVSPAAVLYYYPDSFQLSVQALTQFVQGKATENAAVAASVPDPYQRLIELVLLDVPDPLPGIRRALCEVPALVAEHPELAEVMAFTLAEQSAVIRAAIEDGILSGLISPTVDAELAARAIVGMLRFTDTCRVAGLVPSDEARRHALAQLHALIGVEPPVHAGLVAERRPAAPATPIPSAPRP
ncbi:MAG: TetR/AcrR family transcriptional regulator [Kineosporiaceae bacterium]|nr:TetR/AcrR family transcriptional regulator [Kineosporiaceae bacterium]